MTKVCSIVKKITHWQMHLSSRILTAPCQFQFLTAINMKQKYTLHRVLHFAPKTQGYVTSPIFYPSHWLELDEGAIFQVTAVEGCRNM